MSTAGVHDGSRGTCKKLLERRVTDATLPVMRRACLIFLIVLVSGGVARAGDTVDCSERFPVGTFAVAQKEAELLAGKVSGFSLVHILRKPLPMTASGHEDPCELVYGFDVFEFTAATTPGALVAGCAGDFQGTGSRDYVVLLRRGGDGRYIPHVFLARGRTFDVVKLAPHATDD